MSLRWTLLLPLSLVLHATCIVLTFLKRRQATMTFVWSMLVLGALAATSLGTLFILAVWCLLAEEEDGSSISVRAMVTLSISFVAHVGALVLAVLATRSSPRFKNWTSSSIFLVAIFVFSIDALRFVGLAAWSGERYRLELGSGELWSETDSTTRALGVAVAVSALVECILLLVLGILHAYSRSPDTINNAIVWLFLCGNGTTFGTALAVVCVALVHPKDPFRPLCIVDASLASLLWLALALRWASRLVAPNRRNGTNVAAWGTDAAVGCMGVASIVLRWDAMLSFSTTLRIFVYPSLLLAWVLVIALPYAAVRRRSSKSKVATKRRSPLADLSMLSLQGRSEESASGSEGSTSGDREP